MGATRELFSQMREQGQDIDCNGNIYQEPQQKKKLKVTINNFGYFYKAELEGERITKEELYKVLKLPNYHSMSLEFHLNEFRKHSKDFDVDVWEMDVL